MGRRAVVRGAIAGLGATAPMTVVMLAGRRVGLMRTPPPKQITAGVEQAVGVRDDLGQLPLTARWMVAHFAYGGACGAIYAVLRGRLSPGPVRSGLLFGLGVWGVSYGAVMPWLGLYPHPRDDAPSRTATMIAAHAVFGVALAAIGRPLEAWD